MPRKVIQKRKSKIKRYRLKGSKTFSVITADHPYWKTRNLKSVKTYTSFMKIFPPSDVDGYTIDVLAEYIKEMGVDSVKVMPRAPKAVTSVLSNFKTSKRSIRTVVIKYAKDVHRSVDKSKLIDVLNATMDEAGL